MLMESMLAVIALIAVASFATGEAAKQDFLHSLRFLQELLQTSYQ